MRSRAAAAPPDAWVEPVPPLPAREVAAAYLAAVAAMVAAEVVRVRREPTVLVTRTAQPLLWLLVFGAALSGARGLPTEGVRYQTFIVPGVLAQSVLFIAIFAGLAVVWERDLGITQRVLVTPVARSAVILGKAAGAGTRATVHVAIVLVAVAVAGIEVRWSVASVLGTLAFSALGATVFASLSMVIASAVRSREQFMGLGQLITLPLLFASNALYAVSLMPGWLQAVARVNPLTYQVEAMRRMLVGVGPDRLLVDAAVLAAVTAALVAVAARTYPRRVA
ncbi:MAG TPA: ABC transporter permease [Acidimicrobiales bacterium]|nr:ABC transporter permease [Acidimicrobiales bacterium]